MADDISLTSICVRHNGLSMRSPRDDDIEPLMSVYSEDFDLSAQAQVADRNMIRQRILDRIDGMRHPTDREDWHVELVVEGAPGDLIGWAWLYPQSNDWMVLESSSWVAPPHRGHRHSRTIREGVLALIFDGIGAELAVSKTQPGNRSNGTSIRLGYLPEAPQPRRDGYLYRSLLVHQWAAIRPAGIELNGYQDFRDWLAQP